MGYEKDFIMLSCGKRANFNCYKGLGRMKNFIYTRSQLSQLKNNHTSLIF